jgi:hypothetical protein
MKTFDQCKDEVAKNKGYDNFNVIDWYAEDYRLNDQGLIGKAEEIFYKEAAELYAQEVAKDAMQWISVKERLPEKECIAIGYQNEILIGYVSSINGYICETDHETLTHVTHWMEKPKPPYQPNQEKP